MADETVIAAVRFWLHDEAKVTFPDDDKIELFLAEAKVRDSAGLKPGDEDYVDTYDVKYAAAVGWFWLVGEFGKGVFPKQIKIGDVSLVIDSSFALSQALSLASGRSLHLPRRDEGMEVPYNYTRESLGE